MMLMNKSTILHFRLCLFGMVVLPLPAVQAQASDKDAPVVVFRFAGSGDSFYANMEGNGEKLDSLYAVLRADAFGRGAVRVDGYAATKHLAFVRSNRVKSELIVRAGMTEEQFRTTNTAGALHGRSDLVVVTFPVPEAEVAVCPPAPAVTQTAEPEPEPEPAPAKPEPAPAEPEPAPAVSEPVAPQPAPAPQTVPIKGWNLGLNVGIPFFWGDMVSMAHDETQVGWAVGVQGGYRFSTLLGVSLSADYARGKTGARGYATGYLLLPDGMTTYHKQPRTVSYERLYSRISVANVGLSLDIDLNRIFSRKAASHRFNVWVSPTLYGQFFSSKVFTKINDARFDDGTNGPDRFCVGLGGSLTLRCDVSRSVALQLKNTCVWMTDNRFDAISTPYGNSKHNCLWLPQVGIVWNIR